VKILNLIEPDRVSRYFVAIDTESSAIVGDVKQV
jgi:hypothetical protein